MNSEILRQLIAKEWYLFRWLIGGSIVAGFASLAMSVVNETAFFFGSISFMVIVIVLGALLASFGVLEERKNRTLLFIMSLPISPMQYAKAKFVANGTAFFVPWLILTAAAYVTIAATAIPDGLIPFTAALMSHLLLYYVALFGVALVKGTQNWVTATVVLANVSINFFIFLVAGIPSVGEHMDSPVAVWNSAILAVLGVELALIASAVGLTFYFESRKKDFV